jgi:hypothetical protein
VSGCEVVADLEANGGLVPEPLATGRYGEILVRVLPAPIGA